MELTAKGKWYRKITVHIQGPNGLVAAPLVLLADGQPGYIINQWIYYLVDGGMGASNLKLHVRALIFLYALTMARFNQGGFDERARQGLIISFIDAKRHGTDKYCTTDKPHLQYLKALRLNWKKTGLDESIGRYVNAINLFDKWQAIFHGAQRLNPSEKQFMSAWEIYQDFKRRTKWDPLVHLHSARTHEKETQQVQVSLPFEYGRRQSKKPKTKKAFPIPHLLKLLDCVNNPRDELLLLLMAGGSLRKSEPLHLFRTDIEQPTEWGELSVRLEHPEDGMTEWTDDNNIVQHDTRSECFAKKWHNKHLPKAHQLRNLRPRNTYGDKDVLYVGFKGMTFGESNGANVLGEDFLGRHYDVNYIWWLDPRIGARAQHVYERYRNECLLRNWNTNEKMPVGWLERKHPWLFINLTPENYGEPLSYGSLESLWSHLLVRLVTRHGVDLRGKHLGMHSLRHFYGWYCASVLRLDLTFTKMMMHHACVESTEVYFRLSAAVAQKILTTQYLKSLGYSEEDIQFLIVPGTPKLDWPDEWMNSQLRRKMLQFANNAEKRKQIKGA